ncbi:hypothetical protein [Gallibacterium anatis]|uniref:Lipoprotein n=1 Tax=Gallibacterium anatis 12656/12 TaxID=1195244 RepID=U1H4V2_9PAST|nr:hypothetical protein [Gallibacterium anatis]ERF79486.1 hypothetical protein N561_00750 [Gallibacterium anatis 12656/12]
MKKLVLIGLVSAVLAGCAGTPFAPIEHTMKNKFDVKQAQAQLKEGSAKLEGSAFLRQNGGGVVTCAGQEVLLFPYTDYANEKLSLIYGGTDRGISAWYTTQYKFSNEDPNYPNYKKTSFCDAQGKFVFDKLSAGTYFAITNVSWTVGYERQGGFLMQKVTLNKGEVKTIVMSR